MSEKYNHKLGLLGLGSRSTLYYIERLNNSYQKKYGGYSTCPFVLYNANFELLNPYLPNDFRTLEPNLSSILENLGSIKAEQWIIPNITLHETYDRLENKINILHPIELGIQAVKNSSSSTAVLFGSRYSMTSNYIKQAFETKGIKIIKPTKTEMEDIEAMRNKLYSASETAKDIRVFETLRAKYLEHYPVIIACTELSLLSNIDSKYLIDLAYLQINAAVQNL